jgi:hypothetical protein
LITPENQSSYDPLFPANKAKNMGQQLRKIVKRTRRKAYLARKKALAKSGVVRKSGRTKAAEGDAAKKAVKKTAKKAAAKKVAKPAEGAAKPAEAKTEE